MLKNPIFFSISIVLSIIFTFLYALPTNTAQAQELIEDKQTIVKAEVIGLVSERQERIAGTDTPNLIQKIRVKLLEGEKAGEIIELENDTAKVSVGDSVFIKRIVPWDGGDDLYSVFDVYRIPPLAYLTILFVLITLIFGGRQGARGLLSLIGSFACIFFLLLPGIAYGFSPIWVSLAVSSLIIIVGSYVTHGFNKTTSCAVIGMIVTIIFVGIIAFYSIEGARLTGFESDESSYLHFNFKGNLDLAGVLLGGMLIGLLGVMYDAAIGQSIAVEELHRAGPHLSRRYILARSLRIGKEHIGALVNTLAIAYVGASLPLLLLFYTATAESISVIINREIFAAEIVRSLVGSIGLILAMPITTIISVFILVKVKKGNGDDKGILEREIKAIEEKSGHSHNGHSHKHNH